MDIKKVAVLGAGAVGEGIRKLVTAHGAQETPLQTQSVHTILTVACSDRQHCARPGCPLPYRVHALNRGIRRSSAVTIPLFAGMPQALRVRWKLPRK